MHAEQMSNICDFISETEKYLTETKIPLKLRPEIREEESFYFDGCLDEIIRKLSKIHHQLERFKIYLVNFEHLPDKDDDKKLLKNVYSKNSEVVALLGIMEKIHKIGRRKTAVARIYLSEGKGNITVNKRELDNYFTTPTLQYKVKQPLMLTDNEETFDISVNVFGGGITGQAEAIRLAISRAMCELNEENRGILKPEGLLTRDPRMVERKKFGQKKARKKFQFSKR